MISQIQYHEYFSEKILGRIFLQSFYQFGKQLRENPLLCFRIVADEVKIFLLALIMGLTLLVKCVGDGNG